MKQVRVRVVFEEVNERYEVIQQDPPKHFRFGAVTTEDFGTADDIAEKLGTAVSRTISELFPAFLDDKS